MSAHSGAPFNVTDGPLGSSGVAGSGSADRRRRSARVGDPRRGDVAVAAGGGLGVVAAHFLGLDCRVSDLKGSF